ncbi:peptidase S24/S26A/S26B/S26C [Fomitopsis serialis]|uniref:peptidase S24/S26A/S26B/S26C n=1 Tax=Fomitopsis serialis TaxID=139415 RepID=UPI0020078ADE|nr:peptidase S24/S26A/S26B/S26C [Neoantrodia serialis]KAH9937129.1 peptidase S24/S26A/S26B/S26C [Neoantrodia serialis]
MLPTMSVSGEWVLENKMIKPQNLRRGDLVTYLSPLDPTRIVCKRVEHVWLSGDNAAMSRDSRVYGPVSMALIKGRLVAG